MGGRTRQGRIDRRQHAVSGGGVLVAQEMVEAVDIGQSAGGQRNGVGGGHGAEGSLARAAVHWRKASRLWPIPSRWNAARRASAVRSSSSGMIGVGLAVFMGRK